MEDQPMEQPMEQQHPTGQEQHPIREVGGGGGGLTPRELLSPYRDVRLHERVKQKLKGSGFEFMFEIDDKITHMKSLLLALVEAYDISTGAFLIGQNKLYFGLEDVLMITGLPIDGKPVIFERNPPPTLTQEQVHELVGVDTVDPKDNYVGAKELVRFINSLNEVEATDKDRINRTARAAALLGIGCMISPDLGKSRVHVKFLNFLMDVGQINTYAWGAASWVSLHTSLKACKKDKMHTSLFGCVFGLEIFFLTHVPKLVAICYKKIDNLMGVASFPLFKPCVAAMSKAGFFNGRDRPLADVLRKIFYDLNPSEVVWQPYKDLVLEDPYLQQRELRRSLTTAVFIDHAVHHLPQVAAQQYFDGELELEKDWLSQLPVLPLDRSKASQDAMKLSIESWNSRKEHLIRTRSENNVAADNREIGVPPSSEFSRDMLTPSKSTNDYFDGLNSPTNTLNILQTTPSDTYINAHVK